MTVDLAKVKGLTAWPAAREEIEDSVRGVLGKIKTERVDPQPKIVDELPLNGFLRQRVNYFVEEWERISGWLFVPEGKDECPTILCCHDAFALGKDEPAGLEGNSLLAFAQHYAELGYATLAPDCIASGERVSPGHAPFDTASFYKDGRSSSALAKMLSDHLCAIDMLAQLKRVDAGRIGVIGHGFGGRNALLLSAFDDRIEACVASCAFTRFAACKKPPAWLAPEGFRPAPRLFEAFESGGAPFDWEHVLALAAPTPTLLMAGLNDETYPSPKSCSKAAQLAGNIYKLLGASDALDLFAHEDGHSLPAETLQLADEWFERWL